MRKLQKNLNEAVKIFENCHEEIEFDIDKLRALLNSNKKGKVRIPITIFYVKDNEGK